MKRLILLAALAIPGFGQDANEAINLMTKHWKTSGEFTLAVAELMPDETAQEMLARARQGLSEPAAMTAAVEPKKRPARAK